MSLECEVSGRYASTGGRIRKTGITFDYFAACAVKATSGQLIRLVEEQEQVLGKRQLPNLRIIIKC